MNSISEKNWLKGAIWTIILSLIAAAIYDYIKDQPILSSIFQIAQRVWNFIINLLLIDLKLWVILVLISFYKMIKWILSNYQKNKIPILPYKLKNYQTDEFENWNWKWKWQWDLNDKKWLMNDLFPYCKKCDIRLLNKSSAFESKMKCPKCQKTFRGTDSELDDYKAVESIVYDNIEKNRI